MKLEYDDFYHQDQLLWSSCHPTTAKEPAMKLSDHEKDALQALSETAKSALSLISCISQTLYVNGVTHGS